MENELLGAAAFALPFTPEKAVRMPGNVGLASLLFQSLTVWRAGRSRYRSTPRESMNQFGRPEMGRNDGGAGRFSGLPKG